MTQTNLSMTQVQAGLSSMVAGINWGQTFIGEQVLPPTLTYGEDFIYQVFGNEGLVDRGSTARGLNSESKQLPAPASATATGTLIEYSAKMQLDLRTIESARVLDMIRPSPADGMTSVDRLRYSHAAIIALNNQIQKEKAVAAIVFGAGSYGAFTSAAVAWDTTGIIPVFHAARRTVRRAYGFDVDTLVFGELAFEAALNNPDFLSRVVYGGSNAQPAVVNENLIASVLGVRRVLVGKAITQAPSTTPGTPGTATALWTEDSIAAIYTGAFESSTFASPSFGKNFYMNVPETGVRYAVRNWINDEGNIEWIKASEFFLPKLVLPAGYLWTAAAQ